MSEERWREGRGREEGREGCCRILHFHSSLVKEERKWLLETKTKMAADLERLLSHQEVGYSHTILYCTVLYSILLYSTLLYSTLVYSTLVYCTVVYCTVLYCSVLYCTVLHCTVLYCTVVYCTVLYCTVL